MLKIVFLIIILLHEQFECWPDGAPCIHSTFESMNPLEAVEHQGGLQLTPPPYEIVVKQKCYWKGQPIELSLKGKTIKDRFKGFAIQPISIGRFLRLDNNGSWQQQCYRYRNSVTHSHDELKKKMKLWWKNDDDDSNYVQFVATVVKSQKEFWVKSILSIPIPPCHLEPLGMREEYVPPPITPPPPVCLILFIIIFSENFAITFCSILVLKYNQN
ncbi:unnamed protein product [Dracunculus medinensis]|uniref:Reelin domain-containing protein n=1 Tax=Dracunculus medinensis TaxID=318479 RepID=A0A0N4UJF6_DRAME|nr:unnamed protein product [Dracunculus medinensis]